MNTKDIIFLSESHANVKILEDVPGFKLFGNPNTPIPVTHGGIAVYVTNYLAQYVINLRYGKSSLSFCISTLPNTFFMGVYVYPTDSTNSDLTDFGELIDDISYWMDKGYTPFIGGDFNSRPGDLNIIGMNSLKWRFSQNIDTFVNTNGRYIATMCQHLKLLPLNHCIYYNKYFEGNFTYYKSNKKSQIDFVFTENVGRKMVKEFNIVKTGWHQSDHLPLELQIETTWKIDLNSLLLRAQDLESRNTCSTVNRLKTFKHDFDFDRAQRLLGEMEEHLSEICFSSVSADSIIQDIYDTLNPILCETKNVTRRNPSNREENKINENNCDIAFKTYNEMLHNASYSEQDIIAALNNYQIQRRSLHNALTKEANDKFKVVIESHDDKKIWNLIDWSGNLRKSASNTHPPVIQMREHFQTLYEPIKSDGDINTLTSEVHIPVTDVAISMNEVQVGFQQMKKGGFDYPISVLLLIMSRIAPVILYLLNLMFFNGFPLKLCMSLLTAIPKTGNLLLPTNYRGIQMQPLLANLYDRVITNRLLRWVKVHDEQTAFQKGKGTIDQIFLLRLIISLIKYNKMTLYIGFFDLSKAFDRVSRYLLLQTLIKMGIGATMLHALQSLYLKTRCVLKCFGKLSDIFETYTGIRQGASSSVILFITFMDSVIDILKEKCVNEPVLNSLHCLLHADDTLILSTNRTLFKIKCDVLIEEFIHKKMSINFKKSGFMIINAKEEDTKCDLKLDSGWLTYRKEQKYLGAIFTDTGIMRNDLTAYVKLKSNDVIIKLSNFLYHNKSAPVMIKLKMVKACIVSSTIYSCESWGSCPFAQLETLQRKALKLALSIRQNTPNEVVYIETGIIPLKPEIYKRQLKYYRKLKSMVADNPYSDISLIFNEANDKNIQYLRHYSQLDQRFGNVEECHRFYANQCKSEMIKHIQLKGGNNEENNYGPYNKINPQMVSPDFYHQILCLETDRILITKYRTGSHRLKIQTDRWRNIPQDKRMCLCNTSIQTLQHVLCDCPLLENARRIHKITSKSVNEIMNTSEYQILAAFLRTVENILILT